MPKLGYKQTQTHKAKYNRKGKNNSFFGKLHTLETKQKMSKNHSNFIGNKNPFYKKTHSNRTKRLMREKALKRFKNKYNHPMFGKTHTKKSRLLIRLNHVDIHLKGKNNPMYGKIGRLHPNWIENKIRYYPLGWTKTFKEQIRYRDGYKCQICGVPEIECNRKLHVHHIDYDKNNIKPENLISLCTSCHMKTNYNRDYWYAYCLYISIIYNQIGGTYEN